MSRDWISKFRKPLGVACLLILGLTLWIALKDLLLAWELETLAIRQQLFTETAQIKPSPISIIGIDERANRSEILQKLLGDPAARGTIAYAIRFLKRGATRGLLIDLSFNGGTHYDDLAGDRALVDSVKTTRNVSSAISFSNNPDLNKGFNTLPPNTQAALLKHTISVAGLEKFPVYFRHMQFPGLMPPFPALMHESAMRYFSVYSIVHRAQLDDNTHDASGDSRRFAPFSIYGGHIFPTLPLFAALGDSRQLTLNPNGLLSWQGGHLHLGQDGLPLIKWYGHGVKHRLYPEFSIEDVVLSEVILECRESVLANPACKNPELPQQLPIQPEMFKDQYVFLGFTYPNNPDMHKMILSPKYNGVYIQANLLDNVLKDDFVHPAPVWLDGLALIALPLLLYLALQRFQSVGMGLLVLLTLDLGFFLLGLKAYGSWNLWLNVVNPLLATTACFAGTYIDRYVKGEKKRQQLRFAFGKYVSPAVLQIIEKHPDQVRLGGQRREMTFLFSDIRNFTTFSENNSPEVVQALLTEYFSMMNRIILHAYRGSINKLIGDAIMAYWGFPLDDEDHAFLAVSAAMAMRDAMREWVSDPGRPPINIGIGVNTGEAVIGNVGSEDFMDFTVIGDAVNVASRLEGVNKEYGTSIIISAATCEKVKDRIEVRALGEVKLKGKVEPVAIYEPVALIKHPG